MKHILRNYSGFFPERKTLTVVLIIIPTALGPTSLGEWQMIIMIIMIMIISTALGPMSLGVW